MVEISNTRHILSRHGLLADEDVRRLQKSISCLEKELGFIDSKLSRLHNHRRAINNALFLRKSRLAPINCLPAEIVGEIFMWVWKQDRPPYTAFYGDPWANRVTSPPQLHLNLLRVCKKWYDIAIHRAAIWSRLRLETVSFQNWDIASLQAWVARSGNCPLDVDICDDRNQRWGWPGDGIVDNAQQVTQKVVNQLQPHLQRCRSLSVTLSLQALSTDISAMLPSQATSFPQLKYLGLDVRNTQLGVVVDLSACPRLSILECYSWDLNLRFLGQGIAVHELIVSLSEQRTMMSLLRCCPFVTICRITMNAGENFTPDEPISRLAHLTELHIEGSFQYASTASFLAHLHLPSLQKLSIQMCTDFFTSPPPPLQAPEEAPELNRLLERSFSPLEELDLSSCCIGEIGLLQILASTPTLRSLTISRESLTDVFWKALTVTGEISTSDRSHDICPVLTVLKVIYCGTASLLVIQEMVLSRLPIAVSTTKPLEALHLWETVSKLEGEEFLRHPRIASCVETGLCIQLMYPPPFPPPRQDEW